MKVAVVGNCQARPVAGYLATMCRDVELLPETVVHLSGPDKAEEELQRLDQAEIIFAQIVQDGYHATHLTTSALRDRYGSRVVVWPNLFFNGNCADIVYLTSENGQRLLGPLGAYHNRFIFSCWKDGLDESSAIDVLGDRYETSANELATSVDKSLEELRDRDAKCDVEIVAHIESQWQHQRLFFTFNHPTAELLIELSRQLAEVASIPRHLDIDTAMVGEPLAPVVPATRSQLASILGLSYRANTTYKGVVVSVEDDTVKVSGTNLYSESELISRSYAAYRAQPGAALSVRYTPNYGV